jgi:hypothetical protein
MPEARREALLDHLHDEWLSGNLRHVGGGRRRPDDEEHDER